MNPTSLPDCEVRSIFLRDDATEKALHKEIFHPHGSSKGRIKAPAIVTSRTRLWKMQSVIGNASTTT